MSHSHGDGESCQCVARAAPIQQSIDEMDWDRGIWCAVVEGSVHKVKQFISDNHSCIEQKDTAGYTALQYAVSNNYYEIVKVLLTLGASVNTKTNTGRTPLHKGAVKGNIEIIKMLLERGADPRLVDNEGRLPIHEVTDERCLKLLSDAGPPVDTLICPPQEVEVVSRVVNNCSESHHNEITPHNPPVVAPTVAATGSSFVGNVFSLKKR